MIKMRILFGFIAYLGLLKISVNARVADQPSSVQSVVNPDKAEYRANVIGTEKHKFGYELGENKHFHHTTTDEDGVRLGCYGHVLEGKKYSTQYVADMKGYRPVHTHDLITVYPRSGGERKASFIRSFSEDEILSQNIRFFFPDGCKAKEEDLITASSRHVPVVVAPPPTKTFVVAPPPPTTTRAPTTRAPTTPIPTTRKPNCVCTCS